MIVVLPVATVQAASQIETPIETRSKQNSNLEGGGDLSYINLTQLINKTIFNKIV
jgi:hypothetical protein